MTTKTKQPVDFWKSPAVVQRNKFKFKSLSNWSFNIAVGCSHACRFCYVPEVSTRKQTAALRDYGVQDPGAEWGDYALLRPLDETKLLRSIKAADKIPLTSLEADGNRAVMFCTTTDPYQVFKGANLETTKLLKSAARKLIRRALELILTESSLNVRILTRSPLAREDFDLYRKFGHRLMFGMSLPTLNDQVARNYEPKAPAPSLRLKTLQEAKNQGLNVYVAVAPTYPECDEADLRRTLEAVKELSPLTIYHEPINIRADNVERIEAHAQSIGQKINTAVFDNGRCWREYSLDQLMLMERLTINLGIHDRLHLWPDATLKSRAHFLSIRQHHFNTNHPHATKHQKDLAKETDINAYAPFRKWIETWQQRISEWPSASQAHVDTADATDRVSATGILPGVATEA